MPIKSDLSSFFSSDSSKFMRLIFKYAQVIINFMRFNLKNIWLTVFNIVVGHLLWQTISR